MAMKRLLLEFDSNKDGVLTLAELRQMSRDLCIPYEEVKTFFLFHWLSFLKLYQLQLPGKIKFGKSEIGRLPVQPITPTVFWS